MKGLRLRTLIIFVTEGVIGPAMTSSVCILCAALMTTD